MISHRPATLRLCDRVMMFDKKTLAADGTYEELCENSLFMELQSIRE